MRIIPRLDVKGPNLVKGIHLEGLRVLGKPETFAAYYYETGADELLFMDVVASLYGRNSLLHIIRQTADNIFIPLTVGGGIRSLDDIREVLRAGADKVSLNTAAVRRPEFVREASRKFGSSTIVLSIEAMKRPEGTYEACTDNGRERTGINPLDWAVRGAELGAGEILLTAIHQEGTGIGFDLDLTTAISQAVDIPVIACGGAGRLEHVQEVATQGRAQAVCLASLLHYNFVRTHSLQGTYDDSINTQFMRDQRPFSPITDVTIGELKRYLANRGIDCRPCNLPVLL